VLATQRELLNASELPEKLRATIATKPIFQPDDGTCATISIGVTMHQSEDTIDAMPARLDKALYRARREGQTVSELRMSTTSGPIWPPRNDEGIQQ
jgi:PleD family two-component response regulator